MEQNSLHGIGVLVTRPAAQAENLCRLIESAGGRTVRFPAIEIREPEDTVQLTALVAQLDSFDLAIFVSVNAAAKGISFVTAQREWPTQFSVAAIGRRTADTLEEAGVHVNVIPEDRYDSESLLALDALQQMAEKKVVIFRGKGGRELLGNTLRSRGAQVEYAEVYQRVMPEYDANALAGYWETGQIDITIVTSSEILNNLISMAGQAGERALFNTPLIVVSERIADEARSRGFHAAVMVADEVSDTAIMETLCRWRQQKEHRHG